jgi:peptidoglycan/xylan/chitin deacetylase (PgdA/CDA1 family)
MTRDRSCILTYHSLDSSGSVISIQPGVFREQMESLAEAGARVTPLHAVCKTPGAIALTFDDGFRNFYEHAFPVLQRLRFPATVFVVSGYCGGQNNWPSQPKNNGIPAADLLRWSEVEELARAGIEIGAHTVTHPRMSLLSPQETEEELLRSRDAIEDRIGRPVRSFAYPYGESTPGVRAAVGRHFDRACGTRLAYLSESADPIDLPRIDMYYLQKPFWFKGLRWMRGSAYLGTRGLLRGLRQVLRHDPGKRR